MKTKYFFLNLLSSLLIFSITQCYAQVTVGSGIEPEKGALLELKEKDPTNPEIGKPLSIENSSKGLLFPKVSLKARNQLTPLYGGDESSPGNWSDNSTDLEKLMATGMVVYNINPAAVQLDAGLYVWNGSEWIRCEDENGGSGESGEFTFDCASAVVHGNYIKDKALDQTNFISITVFTTKAGTYEVETTTANPANPVKFEGSGTLKDGSQTIILNGSGTPPESGMFSYNIKIKGSSGSVTCPVQVSVAGRTARGIKIIYFGEYQMGDSRTLFMPDKAAYKILMNKNLFGGSESMCPVKGMELEIGGNKNNFRTDAAMLHATKSEDPADIIIIGYDYRPNSSTIDMLADYVKNNGVVIFQSDHDGDDRQRMAQRFIDRVFEGTSHNVGSKADYDNRIALNGNCPLVKGPYVNLTGKYVQRDGGWNFIINNSSYPQGSPYSLGWSNNGHRALMHPTLGCVVIGDAGWFAGGTGQDEWHPDEPAVVDHMGYPVPNTGATSTSAGTHNAHLFTNIMMWAIEYVHEKRPNGGQIIPGTPPSRN